MEFEFWWLLTFPLFFGLGWLAARIDIKQLMSESRALPLSYFRGLNFLLNEQPDKAIEAFIEVVKVDPQTIELHFALGSLFRRRGEVDRAIRMHQNLAERADLEPEQKLNALFELAQDYLKAGLLDRAEELFVKLQNTRHGEASLKFLLEVYQQEKDWSKAVIASRELAALTGQSRQKEIANFYCELAATDMMNSRPEAASEHLQEALAVHRNSVRASVLLGDVKAAQGQWAEAIDAWKKIESQSPAHLQLVAEKLLNAYREIGAVDEGLNLLRGYLANYASLDL
ncbi:MAG: lipopolysaccharide assembly protein LapB, partial [Burkholderiales bacterium]|nr:lipopolysaccharide assembly protein LapB [Burkholderiales bacterium]